MNKVNVRKMIFSIPMMSNQDWQFIQDIRKHHDVYAHHLIDPHFTFLTFYKNEDDTVLKTALAAVSIPSFDFTIKRAVLMPPQGSHRSYYAFLIPDAGKKHFYEFYQRIDNSLPATLDRSNFIPHITIGVFNEASTCLALVNTINDAGLNLKGSINNLVLGKVQDNTFKILSEYKPILK